MLLSLLVLLRTPKRDPAVAFQTKIEDTVRGPTALIRYRLTLEKHALHFTRPKAFCREFVSCDEAEQRVEVMVWEIPAEVIFQHW
jgi:hypothetical protein